MPAIIVWLLGGLVSIAGSIAGRVLLSLAFGWVAYQGADTSITWVKSQALQAFTALDPAVLGMLATMKVGEAISIIFSALLARMALNGLSNGGAIYKLVRKA